jgi:hypothetical protein
VPGCGAFRAGADGHDVFVIVAAERVLERLVVLLADCALSFAVEVEQVAKGCRGFLLTRPEFSDFI